MEISINQGNAEIHYLYNQEAWEDLAQKVDLEGIKPPKDMTYYLLELSGGVKDVAAGKIR